MLATVSSLGHVRIWDATVDTFPLFRELRDPQVSACSSTARLSCASLRRRPRLWTCCRCASPWMVSTSSSVVIASSEESAFPYLFLPLSPSSPLPSPHPPRPLLFLLFKIFVFCSTFSFAPRFPAAQVWTEQDDDNELAPCHLKVFDLVTGRCTVLAGPAEEVGQKGPKRE